MTILDTAFATDMARLAKAAYNTFERDEGMSLREELQRCGLTLVRTFDWMPPPEAMRQRDQRDHGAQAYVASGPDYVVVVFRGTSDGADWVTNLRTGKRRVEIGDKVVYLHAGFYLSYQQIAAELEAAVHAELDRNSRPLVFTGHSLGGALAQIATAMSPRPELTACYTFGAPRAAGSWFRRTFRVPHYRVICGWDVVPTVPPFLLGYSHVGRALHLRKDPPETYLGMGRSMVKTTWINLRSIVGLAFGRPWPGITDHAIDRYLLKLSTLKARSPKV